MPLERLQKALARAGVASRRKAEELIASGRVTVDGRRVSELGIKVDGQRQQIRVDGKLVQAERLLYVLFHKPKGILCTARDPEGRPTIYDYLRDVPVRVHPIGRLDFHTSGVLLLSNDGDFSLALAHPRHGSNKVYVAKVRGIVLDEQLERWRQPLVIDGKKTRPAEVKRLRIDGDKTWLELRLHEGKNRQIHRLGEETGNTVLRLARIAVAGITHEGLRPGQWRYLSKDELLSLKQTYGVPKRIRPAPPLPESASERRRSRTVVNSRRKSKPAGKRQAGKRS